MYNKAEDEKGNKPWIENVGQAIAVTPIQNTQQEKPRKCRHDRLCKATGQQRLNWKKLKQVRKAAEIASEVHIEGRRRGKKVAFKMSR